MKAEDLIIRSDQHGRVVALSQSAERALGREFIGRPCDQAVRALAPGGKPICQPGCASELAQSTGPCRGATEAVIRGRRTMLRCERVGQESVIWAEAAPVTEVTERLTQREKEVLGLVAQGLSSASIATRLGISPATVRTHVEHARGRLGARTRAEAVLKAVQSGQLKSD